MEKIPLTRAGHTALSEELKALKTVERPAVIRAIAEAREHGDLSENAEYHAARERQSFIGGGEKRAYIDLRDLGGGREALIPPGESRATTDPDIAAELAARRVKELEGILAAADVIDTARLSGPVKFGAKVTLVDEDTEEEKTFQLVGEPEADLERGKLNVRSPLARALIGKDEGDQVEVRTPGGEKSYEILRIEYS